MKPDYRGSALKHAHTANDAAAFLGKFDKKRNLIIDKKSNLLSNIVIEQI